STAAAPARITTKDEPASPSSARTVPAGNVVSLASSAMLSIERSVIPEKSGTERRTSEVVAIGVLGRVGSPRPYEAFVNATSTRRDRSPLQPASGSSSRAAELMQ